MSAYSVAVLADSPTMYWRLNELTGTSITDSSGNANAGTYNGGFTLGSQGALGDDPGVKLNGTTGTLTANAYNPFTGGSQRTFEMFLKRNTNNTGDIPMTNSTGSASSNQLWTCESGSNDMKWWPNTASSNALWSNAIPGNGIWFHVALVHDDTAHTSELYINGRTQGLVGSMPTYSGGSSVVIGNRGGPGGDNWFDGWMDEVAIYQSALTATQVMTHFKAWHGPLVLNNYQQVSVGDGMSVSEKIR